jgi:hypothetical protein
VTDVACVDPDGRLAPIIAALADTDAVSVRVVETVGALADEPTPPDCVLLLHAPTTDALPAVDAFEQLATLRATAPPERRSKPTHRPSRRYTLT